MKISTVRNAEDDVPKSPVFLPHRIQSSNPRWANFRRPKEEQSTAAPTPPERPISNTCIGPIPFLPAPGTPDARLLRFGRLSVAGIPLGIFFVCVGGIFQSNAAHYDQTWLHPTPVNPLRVIAPILWILGGCMLVAACTGIILTRIKLKKMAKINTVADSTFTNSVSAEIDHSEHPTFIYGGGNLAFMHDPVDLSQSQGQMRVSSPPPPPPPPPSGQMFERGTSNREIQLGDKEPNSSTSRQEDHRVVSLSNYLDPGYSFPHHRGSFSSNYQNPNHNYTANSHHHEFSVHHVPSPSRDLSESHSNPSAVPD